MDIYHTNLSIQLELWHLGCFHHSAIMKNVAMNAHVQVFIWTYVLTYLGHSTSMFNILRTVRVFSKEAVQFYILNTILGFQFCPIFASICYWLVFLVIAILIHMMQNLVTVLICISIMENGFKYIFMWFFIISISSLLKCVLRFFAHLKKLNCLFIIFVFYLLWK